MTGYPDVIRVRHLGDLLLEQFIVALGELREPPLLLGLLPRLRAQDFLRHLGDLLLLQIPFDLAREILARQTLDIG